jgi:dTDP-4-dehydrorhamnose reductase
VRVAITGATGRLGSALVRAFADETVARWGRPEYDLDVPFAADRLVERDRPELVVHAAAWTDVDACARKPELAMRRNAVAVRELAAACGNARADLLIVSTNEVFPGERCAGAYAVDDSTQALNPYGESKLAGERMARIAFEDVSGARLFVVRTAWLFGDPGNDFPEKIVRAARTARAAKNPVRVVGDEIGTPSYAPDVARFIRALVTVGRRAGTYHAVSAGRCSRAEWAREILRLAGEDVRTEEVSLASWRRDSTPPRCAPLAPSLLSDAPRPRPWQAATAEYVPLLLQRLGSSAGR